MQSTQDTCEFVLLLVVQTHVKDKDKALVLKKLKDSASYMQWSDSIFALLQEPRSSKRFDNLV